MEYRESSAWDDNQLVDLEMEVDLTLELPDDLHARELFRLFFGPPLPSLFLTERKEAIIQKAIKVEVVAG
ncbi:MAG: hypothetical protein PHN69_03795 [Candidatus Pacebacteria bacterium]|nr:hypothetical protein [Candidatus Paceibacterota bacterium]